MIFKDDLIGYKLGAKLCGEEVESRKEDEAFSGWFEHRAPERRRRARHEELK